MPFIFSVRVVPGSGKQLITVDKAGRLTCYLLSQAEKGLANKELIKFLAKTMGLSQADVTITAGATGRTKYIRISMTLTYDQLLQKLGIAKQLSIM